MANWYNEFSEVYPSVLIKAIEAVKHNPAINNFPAPNMLWKAIHEIRSDQWQKKKIDEQSTAREFFKTENKSGCGQAAIILINALMSHKITTNTLVQQMYIENETYPFAGWGKNAEALNAALDYYHEPDTDKRRVKRTELDRLEKHCEAIQ